MENSKEEQPNKISDEQLKKYSPFFCLGFIAGFHNVPCDMQGIIHEFYSESEDVDISVLRAAKHLNLKAKKRNSPLNDATIQPTPFIFYGTDGYWRIFGGIREEKALIREVHTKKTFLIEMEKLDELWTGDYILISPRSLLSGGLQKFNLSWFIPSILKYKRLFGEVLLASFFIQIFGLVTPIFFQVVVDKVLSHRSVTTLDVLAIGFLAVSFFEVVLGWLRTWIFSHTAYRVDVQLGIRLFHHLCRLPISYFSSRRVGDTVARVRELENLRRILTSSTLTVIVDTCFAVVFIAAMLFYSGILTGLVMVILPFYALLSLGCTPLLRRLLEQKFSRGAESQAFLVETITDIRTVKSMAVEPLFQNKWEGNIAEYVRAAFQSDNLGNTLVQSTQFLDKLTTVLILWVGATLVMGGDLSVGQLIAFNMLAQRVSGPILRLARVWQDLQQAGVSMRRLGDILNSPIETSSAPGKLTLPQIKGAIRFENVFFRYMPDGPYILQNVSFTVKPGESLGIVGRSGSGKSTITNLLQRFYVPEQGKVQIDGLDLTMADLVWLRSQLGVVLQENTLFNRSVRDNIALSNPTADINHIMHVAKLAGAHEFIMDLAQGYDTIVGEHGSTLSGGQRQRLAIARALLRNPRIIIFDEATSALDYESEHIIRKNMGAISQNRTVVHIAHRLSTIMHCSQILVMEKGKIIEVGNHKTLLERGGYYKKLWDYQIADSGALQ